MSTDLDWTTALGEAVVADQGGVLEAIQRFRRKVQATGNLKSDDKQTIVVAGSYPTYGYGGGNNTINVNRSTTLNTGNINTGNVTRTSTQSAQGTARKSEKQPGQVSGATASDSRPTTRTGDAPDGGRTAAGGGRSNAPPSGDTWRFGIEMQYALSPKDEIGVAAEYLRAPGSSDPSALISGSYDHPKMLFMSMNHSFRF